MFDFLEFSLYVIHDLLLKSCVCCWATGRDSRARWSPPNNSKGLLSQSLTLSYSVCPGPNWLPGATEPRVAHADLQDVHAASLAEKGAPSLEGYMTNQVKTKGEHSCTLPLPMGRPRDIAYEPCEAGNDVGVQGRWMLCKMPAVPKNDF